MGDQEKMGHEYYLSWTDRYTPWKEFAWTVSFWKEYLKASASVRFIKLSNTVPCYSAQIKHLNLQVSKGPLNPEPLFLEEVCNATCPEKCSSGNWMIRDNDLQRWKENNIINIDCGKKDVKELKCKY